MKNKLMTFLSAMALFIITPTDAATPNTPAATQASDNNMQIATHIKAEDLYGFWGMANENEDGALANFTLIKPDGTGRDLMILFIKSSNEKLSMMQEFTWQFDEQKQIFNQTTTQFKTLQNGKESTPEYDKKHINKTQSAKPKILIINGKPKMLEMEDLASKEKSSYFKIDERQLLEKLNQEQSKP